VLEFVSDRGIYERVIRGAIPEARERVWIGTADLKDLHVEGGGRGRMEPFTAVLARLAEKGGGVRLIHAKEPGERWRMDFDRYPALREGLERMLCPRVHFKCVLVDGRWAYIGSANLTGAGMGAKSVRNRNFENGVWTDEPQLVHAQEEQFDMVWRGGFCARCGRKAFCGDCPLD
jgi:phosphatidylserine/phosphatidylglycerophosphate/cardiolipin synthase-like enzyme